MMMITSKIAGFAVALLVLAPAAAHARGAVLDLQKDDIYIDLGSSDGVAVGSQLTLFHVIEARHPVTKKKIRDSFPLGKLRVVKTGTHLCIARADADLRLRVRVGDEVEIASARVTYVDPWTTSDPTVEPELQIVDPNMEQALQERAARLAAAEKMVSEADAMETTWRATLGKPIEERVRLWRLYLDANGRHSYATAVATEIRDLERQIAIKESEPELTFEQRKNREGLQRLRRLSGNLVLAGPLAFAKPTRILEGAPIEFAFFVPQPTSVKQAWVYYRNGNDDTYKRKVLKSDGDAYLRMVIPGNAVRAPNVEYFVALLGPEDVEPISVAGSAEMPLQVEVNKEARPDAIDSRNRSRVTFFMDYVEFDGFNSDYDQYLHAEIDFMYRFHKPIYAMRLGFGTMSGIGGPTDAIDEAENKDCTVDGVYMCRKVGYNYAYTEFEFRLSNVIAVMVRPQWGSAYRDRAPTAGEDREFFSAFGLRGRLRLGKELESNLVIGAAFTEKLGKLFEGAFTWDVIPLFPIVLSVQVTDQPVLEDMGVRLIADVGWRNFSWFYPSVRVAYQARDIDHAGTSAGLALNFDW